MKIRNQTWLEFDDCLILFLREPFWSAHKKYGWKNGIEGFGVSLEAIYKAEMLKKKIRVSVAKYGSYEITYDQALKFEANKFYSKDEKILIIIPRDAFNPIDKVAKAR